MLPSTMFLGETKQLNINHSRDGIAHTLAGAHVLVQVLSGIDNQRPIVTKSTDAGTVVISSDQMSAQAAILPGDTLYRGMYMLKITLYWVVNGVVTERYISETQLAIN